MAVEVQLREVFAERLRQAVQAIGLGRRAGGNHLVLAVEAGHVVRAREHHAAHARLARGLVQVVGADDVGRQDRLPRLLGGDAAHVHDGVDAVQQRQHGAGVGQVGPHHLFGRRGGAQVDGVRQAQQVAVRRQSAAQLAAEAAGGAGQEQAVERVGRHGGTSCLGCRLSSACHKLSYN